MIQHLFNKKFFIFNSFTSNSNLDSYVPLVKSCCRFWHFPSKNHPKSVHHFFMLGCLELEQKHSTSIANHGNFAILPHNSLGMIFHKRYLTWNKSSECRLSSCKTYNHCLPVYLPPYLQVTFWGSF